MRTMYAQNLCALCMRSKYAHYVCAAAYAHYVCAAAAAGLKLLVYAEYAQHVCMRSMRSSSMSAQQQHVCAAAAAGLKLLVYAA
jgi:hypothetical protein